ncbi:bifunctional aminoglycoside phosphotransferase/ATP-binding protein [Schlesneria paludicola]|uniref:bifunctional aminoglycoside phosphotransferase/ATP-binding protein n=1 Tax=Schlesneria paludicola TaxID=360056 RepID=UPI00029B37F6|nr:bifunctional aminoglycoside phosphotransferase/ATP-binding protein [Schlesneria paludicola]
MTANDSVRRPDWFEALLNPQTYPHPVQDIRLLETHISWVVLTGEWAYKLKKPVNLGFVDFTTLELRHAACEEELRLNHRTAPELYDSVIGLTSTGAGPRFAGSGPVLEYAVRMYQFPDAARLDSCLDRMELSREVLDELASEIADLHQKAAVAPPESAFGGAILMRQTVQACIDALKSEDVPDRCKSAVAFLAHWTDTEWRRLCPLIEERKRRGFVRECHGDLHLGNLVLIDGKPTLFDCLEFNPDLRWIDVLSDVAFLLMDLLDRGEPDAGWYLLNRYLERTGDFGGLIALRYFLTYRALVRAKVAALRLRQAGVSAAEQTKQHDELESYLTLAQQLTERFPPSIVLMNGVCGSGKTGVALTLAATLPAIQIRSDVERKRLAGLWPAIVSNDALLSATELYSEKASELTYVELERLSRTIVSAGYSVIVDAAFLQRQQRARFAQLAKNLSVPIVIVACTAPQHVLEERVRRRQSRGKDASDGDVAVLHQQVRHADPLTSSEVSEIVDVDTSCTNGPSVADRIRKRLASD